MPWSPCSGCSTCLVSHTATDRRLPVATLGELLRPVGAAEWGHAESPYAEMVLPINREAIHHLAEVSPLRDLHLRRDSAH